MRPRLGACALPGLHHRLQATSPLPPHACVAPHFQHQQGHRYQRVRGLHRGPKQSQIQVSPGSTPPPPQAHPRTASANALCALARQYRSRLHQQIRTTHTDGRLSSEQLRQIEGVFCSACGVLKSATGCGHRRPAVHSARQASSPRARANQANGTSGLWPAHAANNPHQPNSLEDPPTCTRDDCELPPRLRGIACRVQAAS